MLGDGHPNCTEHQRTAGAGPLGPGKRAAEWARLMAVATNDEQQQRVRSAIEVERLSLSERQAAIEAGVVLDPATAPPEVRAFVDRASRRYLDTFGTS